MAHNKPKWPLLRWRKTKTGRTAMVDCGMIDGRRVRFFYRTMDEAETKAALLRVKRQNEGDLSLGMSSADRIDAETSLALLKPHGVTLCQASKFYLKHLDIIRSTKTIGDAIAELLIVKKQDGRSHRYLRDLKSRLQVFKGSFASRVIHEVEAHEIDIFLRELGGGPINRNNYRRIVSVLFGFAVKRRYALKNPIGEVEIASVEMTKPGILSLEETRTLLAAATPEFLPVVAVGLFAGLRPESEIWRLDWSDIDLEERTIDIQKSKNLASHRFVRIEDNLLEWLTPHMKHKGWLTLRGEPYFRRMRETRERAATILERQGIEAENLRKWPNDCLRHTYASCHYAAFKNAADTAEQLGHAGNLRMFFRHYRNRVKHSDALAFWQLRPEPLFSVASVSA